MGIYLRKMLFIAGRIEQDALSGVFDKQYTYFLCVGGRQEIGPNVFRSNCISLCFLIVLTLIVSAIEKLNPMMRASSVSVAVKITA
jgi:hypothetical protein